MGHSDKIHKDHYRQPLASRDILKISQYLEAVQGNTNNSEEDSSPDSNSENNEIITETGFINITKKEGISLLFSYFICAFLTQILYFLCMYVLLYNYLYLF